MVYVLNKTGNRLMPCSQAKARHLLKGGKASVVSRCPFAIKLAWVCEEGLQEITASLVTNSSKLGVAAESNGKCLYAAETELRQDISKKMNRKRGYRKTRRARETRYRKQRSLNRRSERRFSPTVRSKLEAHEREVKRVERFLPVTTWLVVRGAKVDGHFKEGSLDEQWLNLQRQVFERDGFKCRHCKKGKLELHAHHLQARSEGGEDTLENLVTLDKECHMKYHKGELALKIGEHKYRGNIDTEVAIIRKNLVVRNSEDIYGFQVKTRRKMLGLEYSPINDACSSLGVIPANNTYRLRCVAKGDYQRTHGRHSQQVLPRGKILGFNRFDKVSYLGRGLFIKMRMSTGYFKLTDINNVDTPKVIAGRKLKLLGRRKSCLISLTVPTPR